MISGTDIKIGEKTYTVPPLNLRLYFELKKDLDVLMKPGEHTNTEFVQSTVKVLYADLKRNYPDMTEAEIYELAYPDIPDVVKALFMRAGFSQSPLEAGKGQVSQ